MASRLKRDARWDSQAALERCKSHGETAKSNAAISEIFLLPNNLETNKYVSATISTPEKAEGNRTDHSDNPNNFTVNEAI